MSSREATELCEILTDLNYDSQRTLLKPELFSKPNFHLVHRILLWLARIVSSDDGFNQYKSNALSETDVIVSLTDLGKLFHTELGLRLDLIALYKADYSSCPELLKVARPIYEAAQILVSSGERNFDCSRDKDLQKQIVEHIEKSHGQTEDQRRQIYSNACNLASEIEKMLVKEKDQFEKERIQKIERKYDTSEIGQILDRAKVEMIGESERLAKSNSDLEKDCANLNDKLSTKEAEIDAVEEKLRKLSMETPNYGSEYEELRKEYEQAYDDNVAKHCNCVYLESCIDSLRSQLLAANPDGSTLDAGELRVAGAEVTTGPGVTTAELLGRETTGPARLLESLLDGASKPMSASDDGAGVETGAAVGTGRRTTGLRTIGLRTTEPRSGETSDGLDGLLREFVADSAAETGEANSELAEETGCSGDDDDDDDDESDEDEPVQVGAPKY